MSLSSYDDLGAAFAAFMDEFISESDRAAVILGSAQIELLLSQLLEKFMLPVSGGTDDLLEGDAPLATFSAKIKTCHRLGLIDELFSKQLHTFRKMRNAFAHEVTGGTLSTGSARDRALSLAEPFLSTRYFHSLQARIAQKMNRETMDGPVVFRAVLALFHVHLVVLIQEVVPLSKQTSITIARRCSEAMTPEEALFKRLHASGA